MIMGNLGSITESTRSLFSDIYKDIYSTKTAQLLGLSNLLEPSLSLSPEETMTDSGPVSLSAKAFGLGGPCYSIDNACASSIYVLKLASYYLLSGQVDCMIAGGVSEVCGFSAASLFQLWTFYRPIATVNLLIERQRDSCSPLVGEHLF